MAILSHKEKITTLKIKNKKPISQVEQWPQAKRAVTYQAKC
jgi:hypothetical protein